MILHKMDRVATAVTDRLPQAGRLIWFDAFASDFWNEQTADGKGRVSHHFCIHPESRATREQAILWIALRERRGNVRRLAVGRRCDDQPLHALHVPSALLEFRRQPIEQFRMS